MSLPRGVGDVVERVHRVLTRKVLTAVVLWGGVLVAVVLLTAWLMAGAEGWRQGTPAPLVLDLLLLAVTGGGTWAFVALRTRWLSEPRVAGSMEEAAGLPRGRVLGSLELGRDVPPGVSATLALRAGEDVLADLDLPESRLAGRLGARSGRWARRGRLGLTVLGPLLGLLVVVAPQRTASAWGGLARPLALLADPVFPPLEVRPGDVELLRGSDLEVTIAAPGRDEVALHWQAVGDVARSRVADVEGGRAGFVLRDVRAPLEYWGRARDGARSPTYRVTPVDPLLVSDVSLELAFPPHTGRAPEEYRGDVPPLVVPVGTRIEVRGRANRPLGRAALEARDGPTLDLEVDEAAFSLSWTPRESGVYRWIFESEDGDPGEIGPAPLELTVVPDSVPEVRIAHPGRDTVLPLNQRQPLALEARDDHGLSSLELVAYRVTSLGERMEPVVQRVALGANRAVVARPLLDVSGWDLLPGDTVRYFARVVDNAPSPREARTREYVLRLPAATRLRREAQRRMEEVSEGLEELAEEAARAGRETRELERSTAADRAGRESGRNPLSSRADARDRRVGFEEQEDVRRALERQMEMEGRVDSARADLEELAEAMREAGTADPELRRDLDELQELLNEISTPESRERLRELAERLEDMDAREALEALETLGSEQEEFRERLEESLERFRRAAVEQDFRATTAEAEELARQERALADALREEEDPRSRAPQQEGLSARVDSMQDRMERLERRLQQLAETDAARQVRSAREGARSAQRSMSEAARQARQGRGGEAGERADRAAGSMEEAAEQLRQAERQMASRQAEQLRQALRQTAEDALTLARRQSDLGEEMENAGEERMAEMRGDMSAVLEGLRSMADNLSEATGRAGGADRELAAGMGEAMEALGEAMDAMGGRPGPTSSPSGAAERAVEALNRVALMAMAGARQAGQQGQGQAAGGQQVQEQLEALAQQQGSVNNRAGQILPMQLGREALGRQLRDLARGQRSVAEELDQLAGRPESEGRSLGDLEALARSAEELARELAGGRLDAETRERQERLFHRLLDAGRSLEKEELSDERESEVAGVFERPDAAALSPEVLNVLRYRLPAPELLRSLSPAERRLVLQYFERLNKQGGRGSGGDGAAGSGSGSGSGGSGGNVPEPEGGS